MKANKFLAMLALGLGFCACSDDFDENACGCQDEKETTYVAFTLDFKNAGSRAGTFQDGTEAGKTEEQTVKTAYVMWVDANGNFKKVISNVDTTPVASSDYYDQASKKYLISVPAGNHTFYAVVNPDKAPTTNDNADTYMKTAVDLNAHLQANVTAIQNGQTDYTGFLMASEAPLTKSVLDGVTAEQAKTGKQNNFTINVQRASAKVTMTCANAVLQGKDQTAVGGTIIKEATTFMLKNRAKEATRMVSASDKAAMYDSPVTETAVLFSNAEKAYNNAAPAYCLENLHAIYKQDNTTYITLKTQFVPENVVDCSATSATLKANPNITGDTKTPASFYVVTGGELTGNYILDNEIAKGTDGNPDLSKLPAGVTEISKIYTNGVCFFGPIWVGQPELNVSQEGPINRNTWYNLAITKITLPGSPTEKPVDPNKPLEPETNVAITLNIMPWNFINKDLELQ